MTLDLLVDWCDDWCDHCGVNPVYGPGMCSACADEENFLNCPYCNGTSCTQECEDEEDVA